MRTTRWLAVIALVAAVVLQAGRAWAPYHVVVVDQVFFGTEDCPNAQYVMMRLTGAGMRFVGGQRVMSQNADGSDADDFGTFATEVSNGALGAHFIMGTADAAALFDLELDQEASGELVFPDGRVCFGLFGGGPVDCVAYGDFTGDNGTNNLPAAAAVRGMALIRGTDTANDQNDFALGAPAPRNNAGDSGVLGVCPGGADTPTPTRTSTGGAVDTATPTRTATPMGVPTGTVSACVGDCDDTGMVAINELIRGVNISLGLQSLDTCAAFDCLGNGMVPVNCLIQGVNNSLNGCPE